MQRPPAEKNRVSISETVLMILVGAALVAGIYAVYQLALRDKALDSAITQIDEIRQLDMVNKNEELTHPWGGKITSEHRDNYLIITLDGVPARACTALALHYKPADDDFVNVQVNNMTFGEGSELQTADMLTPICTKQPLSTLVWSFK
jgi:hypothetical protein